MVVVKLNHQLSLGGNKAFLCAIIIIAHNHWKHKSFIVVSLLLLTYTILRTNTQSPQYDLILFHGDHLD